LRTWRERLTELADLERRQLFFIGGVPRSGTTWLQLILDAHPDISCRGEGHFLQFLATPLSNLMQRRRELLDDKNANLLRGTSGYPLPAADDYEYLVASAILLAFSQQCEGESCHAIGEKTPENVFFFPNLKRLFPNAKFIGIVRDPRDALTSSWFLVHKPATEVEEGASLTAHIERSVASVGRFVQTMLNHRERYPNDATIVTYEALLDSPDPIVAGLFRFLGVADAPDIVAHCVQQASFAAVSGRPAGVEDSRGFFRKGVKGDWVTAMTPDQSNRILAEVGWMFPIFGWQA
jgi:hypothetical protein